MGVIYLMRHAQAPAAAYGRPMTGAPIADALTTLGLAQAERAGRALLARVDTVDHAVSGRLPRQRLTLDVALRERSEILPVGVDEGWDEYDIDAILGGTGKAAEMSDAALQAVVDRALKAWVRPDASALGGIETYEDYRRRCTSALERARQRAGSGQTVVVVSSSGTITQALAQLWGLDGMAWIRLSRTMVNASLTKLIVGRGGVSVVSMNEHAHLEVADEMGHRPWMTFR